jgi:protein SCO1/2
MQRSSFFLLVMVLSIWGCKDQDRLPFLGTHDVIQGDTVYYTIPKFYGLRDQEGKGFSFDQIKGKVFVAEFFFSRCKSICPIMTSQMARIQDEIKSKQWQGKVALLSHTVDPMYDQPEVLKSYAKTHGADFSIWTFVNADSTVYSLAQQGYLLSAFPSVDADGGFFHTDQLTLIDKNFHIRGYYDGTSTKAVDELIKDLSVLMSEED